MVGVGAGDPSDLARRPIPSSRRCRPALLTARRVHRTPGLMGCWRPWMTSSPSHGWSWWWPPSGYRRCSPTIWSRTRIPTPAFLFDSGMHIGWRHFERSSPQASPISRSERGDALPHAAAASVGPPGPCTPAGSNSRRNVHHLCRKRIPLRKVVPRGSTDLRIPHAVLSSKPGNPLSVGMFSPAKVRKGGASRILGPRPVRHVTGSCSSPTRSCQD